MAARPRRSRLGSGLEPEIRVELERRVAEEPERVAARARVVLLAAEGLPDRRIAGIAGMHHNRVAVWRRRFVSLGLAGLDDIPRPGRPPVRGEEQLLAAAGRPLRRQPAGDIAESSPPSAGTAARADSERGGPRHWRARQALERAADGTDLVSRLLAEQDAGKRLLVAGVYVTPRASGIAVVSCGVEVPRGLDAVTRQRHGVEDLFGFVVAVTRAWRDVGRLHVLVEQSGRARRQGRRRGQLDVEAPAGAPLRIYVAGGRAAWTVQAELILVLARQAGADSPLGGLARLRDHRRRTAGEAVELLRSARPRAEGRRAASGAATQPRPGEVVPTLAWRSLPRARPTSQSALRGPLRSEVRSRT